MNDCSLLRIKSIKTKSNKIKNSEMWRNNWVKATDHWDIHWKESFHISNNNDATLVVSSKEHIIPYGTCKLTKKGHLQNIIEKPKFDFFVNG